jgi:hypothetical protein
MTPIEEYVATLAGLLRLPRGRADRLLVEVEDHLRSAAEEAVAVGMDPVAAERVATGRCGSAREVAFVANGGRRGVLARVVSSGAALVAVGSFVVLVGTVVTRVVAAVTSTVGVYGLPADASPSRTQVAHWLAVQPSASGWRGAAALENASDSVVLRGGAALLALVVCGVVAAVLARRWGSLRSRWLVVLPAVAFGAAAVVLFVLGAAHVPVLDWGRGQAWSDASVSLVAALVCGGLLLRRRDPVAS